MPNYIHKKNELCLKILIRIKIYTYCIGTYLINLAVFLLYTPLKSTRVLVILLRYRGIVEQSLTYICYISTIITKFFFCH